MLNVIMTIFLSDSVDYGEVMNGTREESVIFSMQTFTVKLASGVAVFLAGLVVDLIHLDTAAAVQTQDTLDALRMWMTIPSVILLIVGIFYILRDFISWMIQGWKKLNPSLIKSCCLIDKRRSKIK